MSQDKVTDHEEFEAFSESTALPMPAGQLIVDIPKLVERDYCVWQTAKESSRKELEAAKQKIMELEDKEGWTCYHCGEHFITHTHAKLHFGIERSGALPACLIKGSEGGLVKYIRELEKRLIPYQNEDTELMRDMASQRCEQLNAIASAEEVGYSRGLGAYTKLEAEKEALERKLAEQQMYVKAINAKIAVYYGDNFTVSISASEELTKLLAASRQRGFEEGKQAGRDELQKELSAQEPTGFVWRKYCIEANLCSKEMSDCEEHAKRKDGAYFAVIPRPTAPIIKE